MIPILSLANETDRGRVESLLGNLRLDVAQLTVGGKYAQETAAVRGIIADVATRGDAALVDIARRFDFAEFTPEMIRVHPQEMRDAAARVPANQLAAIRRSIAQVREYQTHILPKSLPALLRHGVELGLRFSPLDSAGLYFPGGKAAYPSSLIMLTVPAQVAGVKQIVVATPPSKFGRSDLVLAACHELKLEHVYRAGGAAGDCRHGTGHRNHPACRQNRRPGKSVRAAGQARAGRRGGHRRVPWA